MREKFVRTLLVAIVSYLASIPLIYLFVRKVYGLGDTFSYTCVGVAILLTLPVLAIRAVQTYRGLDGEFTPAAPGSSGWPARAKALWLRSGWALLGTTISAAGIAITLGDHLLVGALAAVTGAIIVLSAATSIVRLTRPADSRNERGR